MGKQHEGEGLHLDFLSQLTRQDKNELYLIGRKRIFEKNDYIFKAGDSDSNVWILTRGRVKVYKSSAKGRHILLWFALSGDIFGMAECMQGRTRMVYARAAEATEGISIQHDQFKKWVSAHPEIAYIIMKLVTIRMREIGQRFFVLPTAIYKWRSHNFCSG